MPTSRPVTELRSYRAKVRGSGKIFTVTATSEREALWKLVHMHHLDPKKFDSVEEIAEPPPHSVVQPQVTDIEFTARVGDRIYLVTAENELEAIRVLACKGVDTSRLSELRRL